MTRRYLADEEHFVYLLYCGASLEYVGMTSDLRARFDQHNTVSEWFQQITRFELETHADRESARERETYLIRELDPERNRSRVSGGSTPLPLDSWGFNVPPHQGRLQRWLLDHADLVGPYVRDARDRRVSAAAEALPRVAS